MFVAQQITDTALTAMRKAASAKGATKQSVVRAGQSEICVSLGYGGHLGAWAIASALYSKHFTGAK